MGKPPVHDRLAAQSVWDRGGNPMEPPEDHDEGCPGAWYRCGFIQSLTKYRRLFIPDGGFSDNILLSRCDDRLVLEASQFWEAETLAEHGYFLSKIIGTH